MNQRGAIQNFTRNAATLMFIVITQLASAATNIVTSSGDSGAGTLRQTILDSAAGDTIIFASNLSGTIILLTNNQFLLNKDLTVDASSLLEGIQINGNANFRIFQVTSGVTVILDSLTITNGAFNGTDGEASGGIYNSGTLTIKRCNVIRNNSVCSPSCLAPAGGIFNDISAILTVDDSTIAGNWAGSDGGGIDNYGTMTLNRCTFVGNSGSDGGGIANYGSSTISQCTFASNYATGAGGAIFNGSSLKLSQTTVASNTSDFRGGGIGNSSSGTLTISNSIIAGNICVEGADIFNDHTIIRAGANIIQSLTNQPPATSSGPVANSAAPLLAPFGNYGGPTLTMPPLPGSPAIDACTNGSSFLTDQRGFLRPVDGNGDNAAVADIGAVEGVFNPTGPGTLVVPTQMGNVAFQFTFTNFSGMPYTVLASSNVALPLYAWANLGPAVETPPGSGQYQFTDPQATNNPQRFYRVRSP